VEVALSLTIVRDPRRDDATVRAAVHAALLDPDRGLFGVNVVGIGEAFYDSQIYAACRAVPGVQAVHQLNFAPVFPDKAILFRVLRLTLAAAWATAARSGMRGAISPRAALTGAFPVCSSQRYDPGQGAYFFLPDDPQHVNLSSVAGT
jgi:hypothetical protein